MAYDITKIPGIMRSKGWEKGATLMDGWFARASNDKPESGVPDTTTITMSWVLGFPRAKAVYDRAVLERVWVNEKARGQIVNVLRRLGKLTGQNATFGDLRADVVTIDRDTIQFRPVGGVLDDSDDMKAALGRFTFHMAVAGKITPQNGKHKIELTEVGIYVWDSYDFNGEQSLGYWSDTDFVGGISVFGGGTQVTNATFRAWRDANGRGGDYLVYSDVRILPCGSQDTFEV